MNSRENAQQDITIDSLIRWALHDSVAGAEPSPQGWEQLKQRITTDRANPLRPARRAWSLSLSRPKFAWHLPLYDLGANRLVHAMRTVERGMPILRLVS